MIKKEKKSQKVKATAKEELKSPEKKELEKMQLETKLAEARKKATPETGEEAVGRLLKELKTNYILP